MPRSGAGDDDGPSRCLRASARRVSGTASHISRWEAGSLGAADSARARGRTAGRIWHGQSADSTLVVTPATAAKHVENIREKLGLTSRTQIAAWVLERDAAAARSANRLSPARRVVERSLI